MPTKKTTSTKSDETRGKPALDSRWIITIEGREFVKYPGLLDLGHQKGLKSIKVEPVQLPSPENGHFAVCKAIVMSKEGETYTDIGDASPDNCSKLVSRHLLRMASTRSIARALRSFTNIGMTCLEELAEGDIPANGKPKARKAPAKKSAKQPANGYNDNGNGPPMSDAQRRAIFAIAKRQGMDERQILAMTVDMFNKNFDALTISEASATIQNLQAAA